MTELLAWWQDTWTPIRSFIDAGGPVLWALLPLTVLLWTLMLERLWYLSLVFPRRAEGYCNGWQARGERRSAAARL